MLKKFFRFRATLRCDRHGGLRRYSARQPDCINRTYKQNVAQKTPIDGKNKVVFQGKCHPEYP